MIEPGEVGAPSIPTQVPDTSVAAVGWTGGTTQWAVMPVNVEPVAICPDQFVDSAAFCTPPEWGSAGDTRCSGPVRVGAEGTDAMWPDCGPDTVGAVEDATLSTLGALPLAAPAAEPPVTSPTAPSAAAPSHVHPRNDLVTSASRTRQRR